MRTPTNMVTGRVNAAGTVASGGDNFSVQKTATGTYVLNFRSPFRLASVTGQTMDGANRGLGGAPGADANTFTMYSFTSTTGALVDGSFYFTAVGR